MIIHRSIANLPTPATPVVATIGNFDGVHRGHQWVIAEVVARARSLGGRFPRHHLRPPPRPRPPPRIPPTPHHPARRKTRTPRGHRHRRHTRPSLHRRLSRTSARDFATRHPRQRPPRHRAPRRRKLPLRLPGRSRHRRPRSPRPTNSASASSSTPPLIRGSSRLLQPHPQAHRRRRRQPRPRPPRPPLLIVDAHPRSGRGYGTRYTVPTINLAPYAELLPANGVYITTLTIGAGASGRNLRRRHQRRQPPHLRRRTPSPSNPTCSTSTPSISTTHPAPPHLSPPPPPRDAPCPPRGPPRSDRPRRIRARRYFTLCRGRSNS